MERRYISQRIAWKYKLQDSYTFIRCEKVNPTQIINTAIHKYFPLTKGVRNTMSPRHDLMKIKWKQYKIGKIRHLSLRSYVTTGFFSFEFSLQMPLHIQRKRKLLIIKNMSPLIPRAILYLRVYSSLPDQRASNIERNSMRIVVKIFQKSSRMYRQLKE